MSSCSTPDAMFLMRTQKQMYRPPPPPPPQRQPATGPPPQALRGPHAQGGSAAALGPAQTHKRKAAEALDLRQKLGRMQ